MYKSFLFYENYDNVQIFYYNFTWTKFHSFYKKPWKLIHMKCIYIYIYIYYIYILYIFISPSSLSHFIILLGSKYLLMFSDFDTLTTMCYFAFCWQMFPLRNSKRSNFYSAQITLKSPLPLVPSALRQPWWINPSW